MDTGALKQYKRLPPPPNPRLFQNYIPDHSAHRLKYAVALGLPHQEEIRFSSPDSIMHLICGHGLLLACRTSKSHKLVTITEIKQQRATRGMLSLSVWDFLLWFVRLSECKVPRANECDGKMEGPWKREQALERAGDGLESPLCRLLAMSPWVRFFTFTCFKSWEDRIKMHT